MSDRYCVFVDAGYLYKAGGSACLGVEDRASQFLDVETFAPSLARFCNDQVLDGRGTWLRTYWYDGAERGTPHPIHEEIGRLARIKLRLGRLEAGQQKGVDSLIVRDLVILAERRAIGTAFLLGGDEDLREGVREAQDRGVEVVLLGIEPPTGSNLSETLVMEADQLLLVDKELLHPYFWTPFSKPEYVTVDTSAADSYGLGRKFAFSYLGKLPEFERNVVVRSTLRFGWIPPELDGELRRRVVSLAASGASGKSDLIRSARQGFTEGCRNLRSAEQSPTVLPVDQSQPG